MALPPIKAVSVAAKRSNLGPLMLVALQIVLQYLDDQ